MGRSVLVASLALALSIPSGCVDNEAGAELDLEGSAWWDDELAETPNPGGTSPRNGLPAAPPSPLPSPVGSTGLSVDGGVDGQAHVVVPLGPLPRGAGGLTPNLGLTYRSGDGNSIAGLGWSLSGFSSVGVCSTAFGPDPFEDVEETFRWCLDGEPLVPGGEGHSLSEVFAHLDETPPGAGWSGQTYQTLSPSPTKITAWRAPAPAHGFDEEVRRIWTVSGDDGVTHVYMYREDDFFDGQTGVPDPVGADVPFDEVWGDSIPIAYSVSKGGARIDYRYEIDRHETRVTSFLPVGVDYVGAGDDGPTRHVALGYGLRPDLLLSGEDRFGQDEIVLEVLDRRLTSVQILGWDDIFGVQRTFFLDYVEGETGRSLLESVQECSGADRALCKPATEFAYTDFGPGGFEFDANPSGGTLPAPVVHEGLWTGDFTGDGLSDVAYIDWDDAFHVGLFVWPAISTGGFGTRELIAGPWPLFDFPGDSIQVVPMDSDADGQLEVALHTKPGEPVVLARRDNLAGVWESTIVCEGDCDDALYIEPTVKLGGDADLAICRPKTSTEGCENNRLKVIDVDSDAMPSSDDGLVLGFTSEDALHHNYPGACGKQRRRMAISGSRGSTMERFDYDVCYDGFLREPDCVGDEYHWYEFVPDHQVGFGEEAYWVGSCEHGTTVRRGKPAYGSPEIHGTPDVHGDFDGDGLTDILRYVEEDVLGENELILSSGGRRIFDDASDLGPTQQGLAYKNAVAIDFDFDGDDELLIPSDSLQLWMVVDFHLTCLDDGAAACEGADEKSVSILTTPLQWPWDWERDPDVFRVGDFNGDSIPDLLHNAGPNGESEMRVHYGAKAHAPAWAGEAPAPDLLVGTRDGYGNEHQLLYSTLADTKVYERNEATCAADPVACQVGSGVVLAELRAPSDGDDVATGSPLRTEYSYENLAYTSFVPDVLSFQFARQLGFQVVETREFVDLLGGTRLVSERRVVHDIGDLLDGEGEPTAPAAGFPVLERTKSYTGFGIDEAYIDHVETTYTTDGMGRVAVPEFVHTARMQGVADSAEMQIDGEVVDPIYWEDMTLTFNEFWELEHVVVDDSLGRSRLEDYEYNAPRKRRATSARVEVSRGGEPPRISNMTFGWHAALDYTRLDWVSERPGQADELYTQLVYDALGNLVGYGAFGDGELRTVTIDFDDNGVFPVKYRNGLGHEVYEAYHPMHNAVRARQDANGLVTTMLRDRFGRVAEVDYPDNTQDLFRYLPRDAQDGSPTRVRLEADYSDGSSTLTNLDRFGRSEYEQWFGLNGQVNFVERRFDGLGNVAWESIPTALGDATDDRRFEYSYDLLGRPRGIWEPDGDLWAHTYSNRTATVKDPLGRRTTMTYNGADELISVVDPIGSTVCYEYDSFDLTKTIARLGVEDGRGCAQAFANGEVIRVVRDHRGLQTELHDDQLGLRKTEYNAFGQRSAMEDAVGQRTTWTYDVLGRPERRTDADGTTTDYAWDDLGTEGRRGLIREISMSSGHHQSFHYDQLSRLERHVRTIDAVPYEFGYAYDPLGRVERIDYPDADGVDGLRVGYTYDNWGDLKQVRDVDSGELFYEAVDANPYGWTKTEKFGDHLTRFQVYDELAGNLIEQATLDDANVPVQMNAYGYNPGGTLAWKSDAVHQQFESYLYDSLDRLESADTSGMGGFQNVSLTYSGLGDILSKSDVGAYTYGNPAGAYDNPRALLLAGGIDLAYDQLGNVTERDGSTFTYTPFNKLATASDGLFTESFTYGPDRERETATRSDGTATTYVGELFRVVSGETIRPKLISQVMAGGRVVAEVEKRRGFGSFVNEDVRFLLDDNLGSPQVVTDDGGTVLQEMSYDAWGAPRNADWLVAGGYINTQDVTVGFTGHEEEQTLGLTNMRGRMFDAKLGRFTTPDPFIETPHLAPGMNRFSYLLNSPTNGTDPTGYFGNPNPGQCDVHCGGGGGGAQFTPLGLGIGMPLLALHMGRWSNGTVGEIRAKAKDQLQKQGASSIGRAGATADSDGTTAGQNDARFLAWAITFERPAAEFLFAASKNGMALSGLAGIVPQLIFNERIRKPYEQSDGLVAETYAYFKGAEKLNALIHSEKFFDELQTAEPALAAAQMLAVVMSAAAGSEVGAQSITKWLRKRRGTRPRFSDPKPKPKPSSDAPASSPAAGGGSRSAD